MSSHIHSDLTMDDINISAYITQPFGNDSLKNTFQDLKLSDADNSNTGTDLLLELLDKCRELYPSEIPSNPADNIASKPDIQLDDIDFLDIDQLVSNELNIDQLMSNELNISPGNTLSEIPSENIQLLLDDVQGEMVLNISGNIFDGIERTMAVSVQPKPDLRARYESDGPRFLPDAKKHPMSITLPDLSQIPLTTDQEFGIVVTMVTSTENIKNTVFIHVNDIIYRTKDAVDIGNGSLFLPLTKSDILLCEKKFPRLSIICKKFENYTFDLTSFDTSTTERITEKYTVENEDVISKVAKGKRLVTDYNLFSYKIVFQLALKHNELFFISDIQCETNLVNEQKAPVKCVKRKASPDKHMSTKRKNSSKMPTPKRAKNSQSLTKRAATSSSSRTMIRPKTLFTSSQ